MRTWVVDKDGGVLGQAISQAIMATTTVSFFWQRGGSNLTPQFQSDSKSILGWQQLDASDFTTSQAVGDAVVDERAWLAVVIEENASNNLAIARANGDATYNPMSAISVYYAQARNEIAVGNFVIPITQGILTPTVAKFNAETTAQYLASIASNTTAIQFLARAPQTVTQPINWTLKNLRPYTTQTANAMTLVGQIYAIIFTFFIAMAGGSSLLLYPFPDLSLTFNFQVALARSSLPISNFDLTSFSVWPSQ